MRDDELAQASFANRCVELQCRSGVLEVLVDRRQEEVEIFDDTLCAPVPDREFVNAKTPGSVNVG